MRLGTPFDRKTMHFNRSKLLSWKDFYGFINVCPINQVTIIHICIHGICLEMGGCDWIATETKMRVLFGNMIYQIEWLRTETLVQTSFKTQIWQHIQRVQHRPSSCTRVGMLDGGRPGVQCHPPAQYRISAMKNA